MFKEGHIYYFSAFKFNNGDDPTEKYFIVLKETKEEVLIGTLPTQKTKYPPLLIKNTAALIFRKGCITATYSKKIK